MNERTTLEKIAPTVEEAIAEGLTDLGLSAEAVDVEVLDSGSRGIFGVGSRQARVRLTVKTTLPTPEPGSVEPEITPEQDTIQVLGKASMESVEDAFRVLDDNP